MNTNLANLQSKFHTHLLGHALCPAKFKGEIDGLFANKSLNPLKSDYVFDGGDWILKMGRTDLPTTPDTHLYRIRKAEKIRTYLHRNHLENDLMVPEKYLYWNENEKRFYAVAKKVPLSDEVVKPIPEFESSLEAGAPILGGQAQAFVDGKQQRALTLVQAKALAELCVLGYTDLSYNNFFFTVDGKVAIIDTEPHKRALKKATFNSKIGYWLGDKGSMLAQQAISGMARLKLVCTDPSALKEVEKIEQKHALWSMTKLIGKIAVGILIIYGALYALPRLSINAMVIKVLKVTAVAIAILKVLILTLNMLSIKKVWSLSQQGLPGFIQIVGFEQQALM